MQLSVRKMPVARILSALGATVLFSFIPASLPPAQAQNVALPRMGDGAELTANDERRLGDSIIRQLYRDPDYIDDPVVHSYVMGIWYPLKEAAAQRGELSPELDERFAWEVLLGRDRSINAFALPGGFLGVHLGLVGAVATRDELASVLAHELSHVTQRHIARLIAQDKRSTPLMVASMILGALAASRSPDAGMAMMMGGQALAVQNQLNFSRDMEREADRVGYGLMAPAGFAPAGFASMFERLQQANRINDNGSWPYLRSHPLTTERMADMQARTQMLGQAAQAQPPTLEHAMVSARARVLTRPGPDALRQWAALPAQHSFTQQTPAQQAGTLYAAIHGLLQLRDLAGAEALLHRLQALTQGDAAAQRQTLWLAAELALAAERPQQALQRLEQLPPAPPAQHRNPEAERTTLLQRAQALSMLHRSGEVAGALQTWVSDHPQDAAAWQALARASRESGQPLRALRAEAEASVAQYDYAAAVDRFKAGQQLGQRSGAQADHFEASIIDTRLRAVQALLREQTAQR
ncbi:M48 family metalloprotease [Comamonas terrigena]|uniref:M48 family metalloprotease n=1 Tax=Comamonas terrigena TaxID=32013 RepID=UPI003C79B4FA